MDIILLLGLTAAAFTTSAFVPQVIKAMRSRKTNDLSLLMLLFTSCGVFLWMIYGFLLGQLPIILANGLTFLMATFLIYLKTRWS